MWIYLWDTLLKKLWIRGISCFVKKSSGVASASITPPSMKRMRSATSRAKPISWVTTIIAPIQSALPHQEIHRGRKLRSLSLQQSDEAIPRYDSTPDRSAHSRQHRHCLEEGQIRDRSDEVLYQFCQWTTRQQVTELLASLTTAWLHNRVQAGLT